MEQINFQRGRARRSLRASQADAARLRHRQQKTPSFVPFRRSRGSRLRHQRMRSGRRLGRRAGCRSSRTCSCSACASTGSRSAKFSRSFVRKNFGGKVLVIGQPQLDYGKGRQANWRGIRHRDAALAADAVQRGSLRASVAALLPAEPAPSPAVDVAEALKAGWLELWYQQKINIRTLVPSGAEALVRMRHPAWGVVPPAYFIPDDKDPHFRALSEFVVGRAIEDWRYLLESQGPVDLSINLPVSFFGDARAVRDLCRAMPAHPAFGGLLIEINSSEVIDNPDLAVDVARRAAPAQYRDRDRQCRRGMAVADGASKLPVRRAEGRPSIRQRLRGRPAEADGMPPDRRAGPRQRRPRHRPGRRDPRGYFNHRVIVFDAETGAYKRHWGAYGKEPTDEKLASPTSRSASSKFPNPVHCVRLHKATASSTCATAPTTASRCSTRTAPS